MNNLIQEQVHMRMSCPGKVTALAITMDGVYCAAGIGGMIHIWEVSIKSFSEGMSFPGYR